MNREIKKLELRFSNGEDSSICDRIARYADQISNYACSGGGFKIVEMPITAEDEKKFGIKFSEDEMMFSYDYERKEGSPEQTEIEGLKLDLFLAKAHAKNWESAFNELRKKCRIR